MSSQYDEMQGSEQSVHDNPTHNFSDRVQLAGDVIDASGAFSNMQQSNAISRTLPGVDSRSKPKADVVPIRPKASPIEQLLQK